MNKITSINDYFHQHIQVSMDNACMAERSPSWKRSCATIDDIEFVNHGLRRCVSPVNSGRHYTKNTDDLFDKPIAHSSYFNSLKSPRRSSMVTALEKQSYQLHTEILTSMGVNYLKQFPELDEYITEAADGHYINHACHTKKNSEGKVYAAGFIYALNLKNGLLRPVCVTTNGTNKNQEIPIFRSYIEEQNNKKNKQQKQLYVYDKAVVDFAWWDKQINNNNYMITVLKVNSVTTFIESIEFDRNDEINTGIEKYSVYECKNVKINIVEYRDPETGKTHKFISTLPKSINPGTIAMLYYKRWTIEKTFNNSKSDFSERKAWSSNLNALNSQMCFTAMTYNIMRVFEETSKAKRPNCIHPSDKKFNKALKKRQAEAREKGGFVNPLHFQSRIVRICCFTIRTIYNAILVKRSLKYVISKFAGHLNVRGAENLEH